MLNLFYGRESLDKDKFLFDNIKIQLEEIKSTGKNIILLVPDQFTLQAERNAFAYLGVSGIMELDILSQSRLGFKVLEEIGGSTRTHIDKYGRHMILAKILADENDRLDAYKGMGKVHSFIDMINNLISEMKQYNTKTSDLPGIIEKTQDSAILKRKLKDIHIIYTKYEKAIEGKYIDTEDYLNLFISKLKKSKLIRNAEIWVTGFDYFTPKTIDILKELIQTANNVNIIMTGSNRLSRDSELFLLTKSISIKLKEISNRLGTKYNEEEIDNRYEIKAGIWETEKDFALAHLEKELYAYPNKNYDKEQNKTGEQTSLSDCALTLCNAANFYAEAESAAAYILSLVREKGYRYRDIVVVCNDMDARASVIKRVFADYNIPAFIDKKRGILHNPIIEYINALIDIISKSWKYEDVFRLIKTGLTPLSQEDCQSLENYVIKYRIRGSRWNSDFKYGIKDIGEKELARLNELRLILVSYIKQFDDEFKKSKTVREKIISIYNFLKDKAKLYEKTEELINYLNKNTQFEYAEEAAQIWGIVMGIFDQMVELLGDEKLSNSELSDLLKAGFESVEIGLLPPIIDEVIVGTMQRTRVGNIKALIVIGANDGLIPASVTMEGLLSEDEKIKLLDRGIEICKLDDLRAREERLAIYKTFSKPIKHLWVGYSATDLEGKEMKPSLIFEKLRNIFPNIEVDKDILNQDNDISLISTPKSTLTHMTKAFRGAMENEELKDEWKTAANWYLHNNKNKSFVDTLEEGLFFTNEQRRIENSLINKLYKFDEKSMQDDLILSPSRLEKFSRCPFAHFINYGLKPEERRIFEIAGREIGDVYHETLMKISNQLTVPGMDITDVNSPWMKISKEECQKHVDAIIEEESKTYLEGVLSQGKEEIYRTNRIKEVCGQSAWALVNHVQQGHIKKVFFESKFGKGENSHFPPIEINVEKGKIRIEGKIDRVDILDGDYVKIIDYKSGREKFDLKEVKAGYKLQLMLYLKAAVNNDNLKPAGVFYFEIAEPSIDSTQLTLKEYKDKLQMELSKKFKLDGIVLDNTKVIEGIAGNFNGYSDIIPVRKTKEGNFAGTSEGKLLNELEFMEFQDAVNETVNKLCGDLIDGCIDIKPKKTKTDTACKYCIYKSICNFDLAFSGCKYEKI
ncbi:PD-(D/E)XK nuclease family protein [Anaerovorax odorimutans]|uniref:PD-(D/E)XK nuclease family protein n=1 Tax=Anaerovorax odorimutans TaxID=109327 RepID=UPI0004235A37|nr:PD-(D/E)XK nuclease family protein [Anaerovorax odorimutans]